MVPVRKLAIVIHTFVLGFSIALSMVAPAAAAVDCSTKVLRFRDSDATKSGCVTVAQNLLKSRGFYTITVDGKFGVGTANAVLNYQRARHITADAIIGANDWSALKSSYLPSNPIPAACKYSGTRICVSKAERKLRMYKNGTLVKTVKIRVGGWTTDKYGNYRVHNTVPGTYKVYNKDPNPSSARYGENVMPWSVMFDPNMYVHYSADFAAYGYTRASHGCVNVRSKTDAEWIYKNTPIGAKVIVY